jgi:hypothetical protein
MAHQHLAIFQRLCLATHQFEVAGHGFTDGAVVEQNLLVDGHGSDALDDCGFDGRSHLLTVSPNQGQPRSGLAYSEITVVLDNNIVRLNKSKSWSA